MEKGNDKALRLLQMVVDSCKQDLDELKEISVNDARYSFVYGKMDSFVTVLELIHDHCDNAAELGLDFDIEKEYPI